VLLSNNQRYHRATLAQDPASEVGVSDARPSHADGDLLSFTAQHNMTWANFCETQHTVQWCAPVAELWYGV
jgi:hypothetical protein